MNIRAFRPADETSVVALWNECKLTRPWNDPHKDIARKLTEQPELFLVGAIGDEVVASVMAGFDGHRGRGFGRALVEHVERLLRERGCPKVGLLVRNSNKEAAKFYRRLGYAQDQSISLGKRLIPD